MQNQNKPPPTKKLSEKPKEKTARDKALEFSRQVPKPRTKIGGGLNGFGEGSQYDEAEMDENMSQRSGVSNT